MATKPPLCVLLVEDEMALAIMVGDFLEEAGYRVWTASRVAQASALVETLHFDVAVLDINIAGQPVFPVAEQLQRKLVPFVFASAYGQAGVPQKYTDRRVLQKPYLPAALTDLLTEVLSRARPQTRAMNRESKQSPGGDPGSRAGRARSKQ